MGSSNPSWDTNRVCFGLLSTLPAADDIYKVLCCDDGVDHGNEVM